MDKVIIGRIIALGIVIISYTLYYLLIVKPTWAWFREKHLIRKIIINTCYGGFGLSDKAYRELIKLGIPVRKYIEQKRDKDGLYLEEPQNEGEVIFDRKLSKEKGFTNSKEYIKTMGRYWEVWLDDKRSHPMLIKVVEKLGEEANGQCAELKIVKIPKWIKYTIEEYDGLEWVAASHKTWN